MALSTCITSGNHECLKLILSRPETDKSLFNLTSLMFTLGVLVIESCNFYIMIIVALLVFTFLMFSWIGSLVRMGSSDLSTILELSGIAIPCIIGIIVMYNLVPIHNVLYCLYLFYKARHADGTNDGVHGTGGLHSANATNATSDSSGGDVGWSA